MLRAIVEEAAALVSLVLFLGMIGIWAQVIATPEPAAPAIQLNSAFKGDRLQEMMRPDSRELPEMQVSRNPSKETKEARRS